MTPICINVMSFNRPHYLERVLLAIKACESGYDIRLIQDGAVNAHSGNRHAKKEDIQECVDIFHRIFPNGEVHHAGHNRGVALQYRHAERACFDYDEYEAAIFIEDDLEIGPQYIQILAYLYEVTKDIEQVGTVSAYGPDRFVSIEEQEADSRKLVHSKPNWGFLVSKKRWEATYSILEQYMDLVRDCDYRERPEAEILEWVHENGFSVNSTSQDTAHAIACAHVGQARLTTCTRNAHYIGAEGLHFTKEQFEAGYYGKDTIWNYDIPYSFEIPSVHDLEQMVNRIIASQTT